MRTILFLCTSNYYRSRFAEIMFNRMAVKEALNWRAISRGFRVSNSMHGGYISGLCLDAFQMRNIEFIPDRLPEEVRESELEASDLIIAMNKVEHYSMAVEYIPKWTNKINYWNVKDIDEQDPITALMGLEKDLKNLVEELKLK